MRKLIIGIVVVFLLIQPVTAVEYTAPTAPESGSKYMPPDTKDFSNDLWYVVKSAFANLQPSIADAVKVCISVISVAMLLSIIQAFTGISKQLVCLIGSISLGVLLLKSSDSMIQLGTKTVVELSDYCKLLIPTLTAATAAGGMPASSAALYTGTSLFCSVLSSAISNLVVPLIYIFICLAIAECAIYDEIFQELKSFVKWLSTWIMKIVLYIFTGYISITGIISGSVDAAAIKATKLTLSGAVPVVGSIISDASESILLSAGAIKNAAGVYGMIAAIATFIGPFLHIGIHYLMLKITGAISGVFASKETAKLLKDVTSAMGLVLGMIGTVCLLLLISVVCFLRSVG